MKREILFRGLKKDKSGFIYGMPTFDFKYIFNNDQFDSPDNYEVIPETIGQATGLCDSEGNNIFDGDIIESLSSDGKPIRHLIDYNIKEARYEADFVPINRYKEEILSLSCSVPQSWINKCSKKIVGNIHQNPEILK